MKKPRSSRARKNTKATRPVKNTPLTGEKPSKYAVVRERLTHQKKVRIWNQRIFGKAKTTSKGVNALTVALLKKKYLTESDPAKLRPASYFHWVANRGSQKRWKELSPAQQARAAHFLINLAMKSIVDAGKRPVLHNERARASIVRVTRVLRNFTAELSMKKLTYQFEYDQNTDHERAQRLIKVLRQNQNLISIVNAVRNGVISGKYGLDIARSTSQQVKGINIKSVYQHALPFGESMD